MKFNKKYCLLFLMTVLVLLLGAGMVSASEAGLDVQVVKDNNDLSTPDNYDVDNMVQSDRILTKSEANVEKTSTKDDTKNNSKSNIDTFVNIAKTNGDNQTIANYNSHSAKISVNEICGRTITLKGLENSGILQESIDVKKISVSDTKSMFINEDMAPILKDNTEVSSNDGIDINTKSNNQLQETDKTIIKVQSDRSTKTDDELPEKIKANVTIVFDDFDNKYNSRPKSGTYTYTFYRNSTSTPLRIYPATASEQGWTNETAFLDKYNSQGKEYTNFKLTTSSKPTGYLAANITNSTKTYEEEIDGTLYKITEFDYTVKYTLQSITIQVYKIWNDRSNNDGIRPANYTYDFYANGVWNSTYTVNTTSSSSTSRSYYNVPVIDAEGNEIVWTIKENSVPEGYTVEYANSTTTTLRTLRWNITNIHDLIEIDFPVSKVWNDSNDNDGVRPSEIYVQLYSDGYREGGVVKLDEDSGWTYTFKNLRKYYSREEINYTVKEVNGPFDYVASYDGGIITNTHEPLKINITVNKTWNDSDDKDGLRPKNITVTLNADGVAYGDSVVLSEDNNWTDTFVNLPKYVNKHRVNYTFTETVPEGYNVTYGDIVPIKDKKNTQISLELLNLTRNEENNLTGYANFNVVVRDQYGSLVTEGNIVIKDSENNVVVNKALVDGLTVINLPVNYDPDGSPFGNSSVNPGINVNISIVYEETENYLSSQAFITNLTEFYRALVVARSNIYNNGEPVCPWIFSDGVWVYCTDPQVGIYYLDGIPYQSTVRYNPDYLASGKPMPYIKVTLTNETDLKDTVLDKYVEYDSNAVQYIKDALFYYEEYLNIIDDNPDEYYVQNLVHILNGYYKFMENATIYPNGNSQNGEFIDLPGYGYEISNRTYSYYLDELEPGLFLSYFVNETIARVNSGNETPNHGVKEVLQDGKIEYQFYTYNPYNLYFGIHLWQRTIGIDYYYVPDPTEFITNITNTHIPENVTINVTKVWNDTNNQDGMRPVNVTVALFKDGILNDTILLNESNGWMGSFTDLSKYANARLINYTINETKVPVNYTQEVSNVGNNYTITNTHIPLVTSLNVTKKWDDKNNTDGKRPDVILVQLYANNVTEGDPVALYDGNNWTYVFENLDKYSNGVLINYTVDEITVPEGYTKTVTNKSNNYTIKNTHVPELINVTVKKIWNDNDNQDGLRPEGNDVDAFILYLYKNNKSYKSCMLSDSNNWTYTFRNVPKYEKGSLVNYTVIEKNRKYIDGRLILYDLIGYTADINRQGDNFTITNTHVPELTNVSVVKVWNDSDDIDGLRPESIAIVLNANGEKYREAVLNSDNHWNCTFVDLPVYKDGVKIRYAVEEPDVPEGYQFGISITDYNITVTNTHIQENITLNVTKVWNDTDDKDGLRPKNITVELLANGEVNQTVVLDSSMNWTYSFTDLRVYKDGKIINYTINEIVPEEYTVTYGDIVPSKVDTNISLGLLNITRIDDVSGTARFIVIVKDQYNEYVSKGSILVTDSEGNVITEEELENGIKYINVPVNFVAESSPYGNNSTVPGMEFDVVVKYEENDLYSESRVILTNITDKLVVAVIERNATEEGPAYPSAPWKFSDGQWVYCADPSIPDWNDTDVNDPDEWIDNYPVPYIKVEINNETILNGYLPYEKYGIPFDEKSLEYFKILLYYFGEELDGNGYTHDQYAGTQEIMQILTGYWTRLEENYFFPNGNYYPKGWYMINNTGHGMPDLETVTGKPLSYYVNKTMELYESGIRVPDHGIRNVTSDGRWEYQFNIYYPYQYYFGETTYQRTFGLEYTFISGKHDLVTNLTNTHIVENISINVTKDWNDTENQDGVRPNNITVTLYVNGKANQTVQINATNWTYTFKDLPKYLNGALVNYTISEKEVTDYTTSIVVNVPEVTEYDGFNVTLVGNDSSITLINTHIPEKVSVNVTKVWDDANNTDGLRPDSILVQLYANNVAMGKPVALYDGNNWTYIFENLDKYSKGVLINYAIEEVIVPRGYSKNVTNTSYNFTINNTHIPEKTNVNVTKLWNDVNNTDGLRPVSVNITLVIDGKKSDQTVQINATNWTYTFENLPKYRDNGTLINYNVTEEKVDDYNTTLVFCEGIFKVINTHIPENTSVNVTKVWNDNNNQDGVRPANVTVQLLRDGKEYNSMVLSENNDWYAVFNNLPKYHDEGKEYRYTIIEVAIPGYSGVVTNVSTEFTVNNTHIPENTSVNVSKLWNDANNTDGKRVPVTVHLFADGREINSTVLSEANAWKDSFVNLPKYSNGQLIVYSVSEDEIDGYNSTLVNCNGTYKFINTHIPEKVNVTVNKQWNDSDNQDNIRPEEVTLKLKADGKEYVVKVVKATGNNWTYTFTDLPKYSNGQEIVYTVEEVNIAKGYTVSYSEDTLSIVNTHVPETIEVNVTKVWNDAGDNDGKRTTSVTVELLADNKVIDTVELSAGNNWKHTFTGLAKYANGREIVYKITENNVPADYTAKIVFCEGVFKVVNTHIPENTSIGVSKVWEDADNQDGIRPDHITIQILANGNEFKLVKVTGENNWTVNVTNLPKYSNGQKIVYTVGEVDIPAGYTSVVEGLTITNTHIPENTSVNVTKVWKDNNNNDGIRPTGVTVNLLADGVKVNSTTLSADNDWKATFKDLPVNKGGKAIVYTVSEDAVEGYSTSLVNCNGTFKFINSHDDSKVNVTINKVWEDNNNQDAIRPENVTVEILANGERYDVVVINSTGDWKITVSDLPEFIGGQKVVYTVREIRVETGYTSSVDGFTITNTHEPFTKEINVTKIWNDNNSSLRPESVTVHLMDGDNVVATVSLSAGNDWKATFKDLPVNRDGKAIVYTVKEVEVPDYTTEIKDCCGNFKIVNTPIIVPINITVNKVWDDNNNNDGIRPDSVTIHLLADGNEVATATLSADNDWKHIFEDLPVNKDGKAIVYNVTEDPVDPYVVSITNISDEFIVTNSYNITKINLTIKKVWVDGDDNDGLRPDNITVILYADGEELVAAVVNEDDDWTYTFTDLQKYNDGHEILYSVDELPVDEYVAVVDGLTITNTHNNLTKNITVSKFWDDDNNNDGIRPDSVTIRLLADSNEVATATLSAGNDWKATFKDLPVNKDGKAIVYTINEDSVDPYVVSIVNSSDGFIVTNSYNITKINLTVNKVWVDDDNNDGVRPDNVTVHLLADGKEIDNPVLLSSNNNWMFTFKDLPKFDNGKEIKYTVVEDTVEGYSNITTGSNNNYTITNTHLNEVIDLNVSKVWDDLDDEYAKRPDCITVNVYANGTYLKSVNLTKDNGWKIVISNLTKYNMGNLIKYSVTEDKVKYYNTTIESDGDYGFIITNKLKIVKRTCVWAWKLIGNKTIIYINGSDDYNTTKLVPKYVVKNKAKYIKRGYGVGKYSSRHYYPKKYRKHYPLNRNKGTHSYQKFMTKEQYRLYIFLCQKCFFGNMSYADFVAILKANGIDPVISNAWNSSGILTFDYDDLEKVPDSIELHDNGGHVQDSSDNVEKHKPASSSGVIDEGKIKLEVIEIEE